MRDRVATESTDCPMNPLEHEHASSILAALRQEILEGQKIRTQLIGFKITLVSTGAGLILAAGEPSIELLAIPAAAAMFFDILINSYSVGIKRIGFYTLAVLDPLFRNTGAWRSDTPTWEEFNADAARAGIRAQLGVSGGRTLQHPIRARVQKATISYQRDMYAMVGNLGLTVLSVAAALVALLVSVPIRVALPLVVVLLGLLAYDVWSSMAPARVKREMVGALNTRSTQQ